MQATLTLKGAAINDVRPLDIYGVPRPNVAIERSGNSITLDGRWKSFYYEITR